MRAWWVCAVIGLGACQFVVPAVVDPDGGASDLAPGGGDLPAIFDLPIPDDISPNDQSGDLPAIDLGPGSDLPTPDLSRRPARSCAEVLAQTAGAVDGLYPIDLGGATQMLYCDMSHDGGGWTLVQRTVYDFTQTQTLIGSYSNFYNATAGAAGPGNAYRLAGQYWPALNVTGAHLLVHTPRAVGGASCPQTVYAGTGATWQIAAPPGNATIGAVTSPIVFFDGSQLSANDVGPSQQCVNAYHGAPWPYGSCCSTCPSYGLGVAHPGFTYWGVADLNGNTALTRCMALGGLEFGDGIGHDNVLEYYVR